jgi:hypothetical protein
MGIRQRDLLVKMLETCNYYVSAVTTVICAQAKSTTDIQYHGRHNESYETSQRQRWGGRTSEGAVAGWKVAGLLENNWRIEAKDEGDLKAPQNVLGPKFLFNAPISMTITDPGVLHPAVNQKRGSSVLFNLWEFEGLGLLPH